MKSHLITLSLVAMISFAAKSQMPSQKNVIVNQTKIAYYEQGKGETILLLHGWPQTSYVWRKMFPEFAKQYRTIAIDLPGNGNSGEASAYDTEHIATIVKGFVDELGIDQFHLVSHDIGSWVAVPFANMYEESLKTLTVMEAGIPGLIPNAYFTPENANKIWQFYFHSVSDIPEFLTKGKEKEYLAWYFNTKSHVKGAITEKDLNVYYKAYKGKGKMKNGFEYYRAFSRDAQQNLAVKTKLNLPVLAIGAQYSVGDKMGAAMNKMATQVTSEVVMDCGHYIPEERPKELVALIEKLISGS
ncbi:MAG: alpha/beta hydrolase [Bacteroidota bacterium]